MVPQNEKVLRLQDTTIYQADSCWEPSQLRNMCENFHYKIVLTNRKIYVKSKEKISWQQWNQIGEPYLRLEVNVCHTEGTISTSLNVVLCHFKTTHFFAVKWRFREHFQ